MNRKKSEVKVVLIVWFVACLVGGTILSNNLMISDPRLWGILLPVLMLVNVLAIFLGRWLIIRTITALTPT